MTVKRMREIVWILQNGDYQEIEGIIPELIEFLRAELILKALKR